MVLSRVNASITWRWGTVNLPRGVGNRGASRSYCASVILIWSPAALMRNPALTRLRVTVIRPEPVLHLSRQFEGNQFGRLNGRRS